MRPCQIFPSGARGREVLCLGAHPDDIEIGCGGTVLRLCEEFPDTTVHWVVLGAHGDRVEEAERGAELFCDASVGGTRVFKDFKDGYFPFQGQPIKDFLESLKATMDPEIIFTHFRDDRHQDHRLVSDLTWNTWRDHIILEYEVPKWDGDVGAPNAFVPLPKAIAEKKAGAILSIFESQGTKHWFSADTFLGMMRLRGVECRAEDGFAEGFYARKVTLL